MSSNRNRKKLEFALPSTTAHSPEYVSACTVSADTEQSVEQIIAAFS